MKQCLPESIYLHEGYVLSKQVQRPASKVLMCQDYSISKVKIVASLSVSQLRAAYAYLSDLSERLSLSLSPPPSFSAYQNLWCGSLYELNDSSDRWKWPDLLRQLTSSSTVAVATACS